MPADAYKRYMARLGKRTRYEPTEAEILQQKAVERVLSIIESEGNEAVIHAEKFRGWNAGDLQLLIDAVAAYSRRMSGEGDNLPDMGSLIGRAEFQAALTVEAEGAIKALKDLMPEGSTAKEARTPGGFLGFCIEKIMALPEQERAEFLASKQTGPQDLDHYGRSWVEEFNSTGKRTVKGYTSTVSHAKQEARKRLNID